MIAFPIVLALIPDFGSIELMYSTNPGVPTVKNSTVPDTGFIGSGLGNCLSFPFASNSDLSLAIATSLLIISALALVSSSLTASNSWVRVLTFPRLQPPLHLTAPRCWDQVLGVAVAVVMRFFEVCLRLCLRLILP